jgi:outer membrane protein, multidrug efflux system
MRDASSAPMQFPYLPIIIAGFCLVVCGCESWRFAAPVSDVSMRTPGSWAAASSGAEGRISSGWLAQFSDADLTRTVNDALAHNRDLKAAATRLRVAEENSIIARSRMLPSAGLSGSASVTDSSGSDSRQSHSLNLAASWEPDLWGRLRNLTNAAEAENAPRSRISAARACRSPPTPPKHGAT